MQKKLLKKRCLKISNLPNKFSEPSVLSNSSYLGKYGKIIKISIFSDVAFNYSISAYVTFESIKEAALALISLDSLKFDNKIICANYVIVNYCQKFIHNKICRNKDCIFLHQKINEREISSKKIYDESCIYYIIQDKNMNSFSHAELALSILGISKEYYCNKILHDLINFSYKNKNCNIGFPIVVCDNLNYNKCFNLENSLKNLTKPSNKNSYNKNCDSRGYGINNYQERVYKKVNRSRFDFALNDNKLNKYSINVPENLLDLIDKNMKALLYQQYDLSFLAKKIDYYLSVIPK